MNDLEMRVPFQDTKPGEDYYVTQGYDDSMPEPADEALGFLDPALVEEILLNENPERLRFVRVFLCNGCNKPFVEQALLRKQVVFGTYPEAGKSKRVRARLMAMLCNKCVVIDRDYRRPELPNFPLGKKTI